jgi:hypothetical protein
MKLGIYSALYDGYEHSKPLPVGQNGVMYRDVLADHEGGWDERQHDHHIVTRRGDPRLVAPMLAHKWWKTHPAAALPDSDVSIWIDASIQLDSDFVPRSLAALGDADWLMVRHPWRTCLYDEAEYSATLPRYGSLAGDIVRQAAWYRSLGHPEKSGLPATGVIVRRHTPAVLEVSEHWWQECLNWSHQDQVSLPVLIEMFKHKVKFKYGLEWQDGWTSYPHAK